MTSLVMESSEGETAVADAQPKSMDASEFKTFVFLDIEGTGLPSSIPKPRIIEIALVAISR